MFQESELDKFAPTPWYLHELPPGNLAASVRFGGSDVEGLDRGTLQAASSLCGQLLYGRYLDQPEGRHQGGAVKLGGAALQAAGSQPPDDFLAAALPQQGVAALHDRQQVGAAELGVQGFCADVGVPAAVDQVDAARRKAAVGLAACNKRRDR